MSTPDVCFGTLHTEENNMHGKALILVSGFYAVASGAAADPVLLNGDMNGVVGMVQSPTDWMIAQSTPDVVNATGPFNNTINPWTLSPNGGTFARMNGVGNEQSEGISQNVSGFEVGEVFEFSFYATNLGFQNAANGSWNGFAGFFEFYADGLLVATSDAISKEASASDPIVWLEQSVQFEVTASEFLLEIRAETTAGEFDIAYMGLDGVSTRIVPAPGAISALAAFGFMTTRRRR